MVSLKVVVVVVDVASKTIFVVVIIIRFDPFDPSLSSSFENLRWHSNIVNPLNRGGRSWVSMELRKGG